MHRMISAVIASTRSLRPSPGISSGQMGSPQQIVTLGKWMSFVPCRPDLLGPRDAHRDDRDVGAHRDERDAALRLGQPVEIARALRGRCPRARPGRAALVAVWIASRSAVPRWTGNAQKWSSAQPSQRCVPQTRLGHEVRRPRRLAPQEHRVAVGDVVAGEDRAAGGGDVLGAAQSSTRNSSEQQLAHGRRAGSARARSRAPPTAPRCFEGPSYFARSATSRVRHGGCSRASASTATASTTSGIVSPVVSSTTASSAAVSGECSRETSRRRRDARSQPSTSSSVTAAPAARCSSPRRRARSSGDAVRNTFSSASGNTTVPMSRPSTTTSWPSARLRCCAHHELAHRLQRRDGAHGSVDLGRADLRR